jgi:RND family efflux transporter MFP subunit
MAKVAGYVKQINVDIGDRVHTGEVLATLEVPEMADDLTRAAASVELSNAEIVRARDEVTRAQASHDVSHLAYQRLLDVSKQKPGLVAQQELDDAHGKDLVAEAQLSAAQSSLAAAQERTVVDRAEQARYHTMYNYTRVIAPFDGVITARYANQGAMIQAGIASQTQSMPVVRLSQNSLLRLMLPVPESAVRHVRLGDAVDVRVPSLDRTFRGRVARFTDRISTATRTMETEVDVPNPKLELVPGMYANVDLELANRQDVLAVPVTGVEMTGAEPFVFRVRDGALERVAVKTGLETADHVEILSGLAEGDLVVVGTRASLKAGDKVKAQIVTIGQPEKAS